MLRKFWICLVALLLVLPLAGYSQMWRIMRYEAGVGLGSIHSFTDIGPAQKLVPDFFNGTRPNLSVDARFKIDPFWAIKLDLAYLMFGGADVTADTHYRPDYDYAFNTQAFEHTLRIEYYILGEARRGGGSSGIYNRKAMLNTFNTLYLYVFAGAGGVMSKAKMFEKGNPANELTGTTGYNNNLLWSPVFPGGIGVKYSYSAWWTFGLEAGLRITLTDFLDGYNDPYYGDYNDFYYLISVKAIYRLRAGRNGLPTFRGYKF